MNKKVLKIVQVIFVIVILNLSFVSAGVGIKWDRESALVNEGEKTCLTYNVYNPWPEASYVAIEVSDDFGELKEILTEQESEEKLIPAETSSAEAIPIKFCFKVPKVYERNCLVGSFICEQKCNEEQKIYDGEVSVKSIPPPTDIGGSGGSTTSMAVSAPLKIRVNCNAHSRDFTLIYVLLALISALIVGIIIYRKYRKQAIERDKEKLKKLQEKINKSKKQKK